MEVAATATRDISARYVPQDVAPPPRFVADRRFETYMVSSDYMSLTFNAGDFVQIDTAVQRVDQDGIHMVNFKGGEPALRRIQTIPGRRLRVWTDKSPELADVVECIAVSVRGRACRVLRAQRLEIVARRAKPKAPKDATPTLMNQTERVGPRLILSASRARGWGASATAHG